MKMKRFVGATIVAAAMLGTPVAALAEIRTADVHFEPGNYGTMVGDAIVGHDAVDYKLGAKAGQKMFVELSIEDTNGDGTIYFNILPPGSTGEAIYVGSMDDDNSETITLPSDGTYTIRVYLMGNDRDTDKTVGFNLDISIQ